LQQLVILFDRLIVANNISDRQPITIRLISVKIIPLIELDMPQLLNKSTLWLKYAHLSRLPFLTVQAFLKKATLENLPACNKT